MGLFNIFKKSKEEKKVVKDSGSSKKKTKKPAINGSVGGGGDLAYRILKRPIISEKSTDLTGIGKYAFKVNIHSNKSEIKKAIEKFYGVKVRKVNVMNFTGKTVSRAGRFKGKRPDFKKAVITLAEGQKIDLAI